jgi:hypothetical protein
MKNLGAYQVVEEVKGQYKAPYGSAFYQMPKKVKRGYS